VLFGVYDAVNPAPADSTGTMTVSCFNAAPGDRGVNFTVGLSSGNGTSPATRWLASGPNRLYYNLYRDAARVQVWGDGFNGSHLVSGTLRPGPGVGNATRSSTHTVYGRIPPGQDAASGNYTDTIVFTLTF
jgi:spore coat protein U-like protein